MTTLCRFVGRITRSSTKLAGSDSLPGTRKWASLWRTKVGLSESPTGFIDLSVLKNFNNEPRKGREK